MKRSAFKPKRKHEPTISPAEHAEARSARIAAQRPPMTLHKATSGPARITAKPKSEPKRNPALLQMAEGRDCLLCPPGQCRCTPGSTVAAHSNLAIHGKAKGRKADDQFSVWAGYEAHKWLDQGSASKAVKEAAFMAAHLRQVLRWREIAADPAEPQRFRLAATWALQQLNSTLIEAVDAAERSCL